MPEQAVARKDDTDELESVGVVDIQRRLSELMGRAGYGNERIVLTRGGKPTAALIGMRDLERLRQLDEAAQPAA